MGSPIFSSAIRAQDSDVLPERHGGTETVSGSATSGEDPGLLDPRRAVATEHVRGTRVRHRSRRSGRADENAITPRVGGEESFLPLTSAEEEVEGGPLGRIGRFLEDIEKVLGICATVSDLTRPGTRRW